MEDKMIFPIKIKKSNKQLYFKIKFMTNNIQCKNKWGFFYSNVCFNLFEKPFIKNNKYLNQPEICYFYIDILKKKMKKDINEKKFYTIFVKLNNVMFNNVKEIKTIFIDNKKEKIFAIANINLNKNIVTLKNSSKSIKIISFI